MAKMHPTFHFECHVPSGTTADTQQLEAVMTSPAFTTDALRMLNALAHYHAVKAGCAVVFDDMTVKGHATTHEA